MLPEQHDGDVDSTFERAARRGPGVPGYNNTRARRGRACAAKPWHEGIRIADVHRGFSGCYDPANDFASRVLNYRYCLFLPYSRVLEYRRILSVSILIIIVDLSICQNTMSSIDIE